MEPEALGRARRWGRGVGRRGRSSGRGRVDRWRAKGWHIGQCAIAAGVAWWIAADLLGNPSPFFAPAAAVLSLGTSYGQRLRRVVEVAIGVAVGVLVGDLLVSVLGTGAWQVGLIVALAMSAALLLDGSPLLVNQAAVQAIIVATLLPADVSAGFTRWVDAVVGGGVALVAATVVPRTPLRRPRDQAGAVLRKIGRLLRAASEGMASGATERSLDLLSDARATDHLVAELRTAAAEGLAVTASSPFRARHRPGLLRLAAMVEPIDRALRSTRVLVRRVAVSAQRGRGLPDSYAEVCAELADACDAAAASLLTDGTPLLLRSQLLEIGAATSRLERTGDLSAEVVLAQMRSVVADLLVLTGMDPVEATAAIPVMPDP